MLLITIIAVLSLSMSRLNTRVMIVVLDREETAPTERYPPNEDPAARPAPPRTTILLDPPATQVASQSLHPILPTVSTNRNKNESLLRQEGVNSETTLPPTQNPTTTVSSTSGSIVATTTTTTTTATQDCLRPIQKTNPRLHDESSRIINMGLPLVGMDRIGKLFQHYDRSRGIHCGKSGYCGECIRRQIRLQQNPLEKCGNFTVQLQMAMHLGHTIVYPQIQYLDQLYEAAPNATYLLPFFNVTKWVEILTNWNAGGKVYRTYRKRLAGAMFPEVNWTIEMGSNDADFEALVCNHVNRIRRFTSERPSLSLLEFDVEDPNVGKYMEGIFSRVHADDWIPFTEL